MALDFALAVASGLVVALISTLFQHRRHSDESILEITRRTEVILHSATFIDGEILQEDTETRIEESTFRIPQEGSHTTDPRISVAIGVGFFAIALAFLLLL